MPPSILAQHSAPSHNHALTIKRKPQAQTPTITPQPTRTHTTFRYHKLSRNATSPEAIFWHDLIDCFPGIIDWVLYELDTERKRRQVLLIFRSLQRYVEKFGRGEGYADDLRPPCCKANMKGGRLALRIKKHHRAPLLFKLLESEDRRPDDPAATPGKENQRRYTTLAAYDAMRHIGPCAPQTACKLQNTQLTHGITRTEHTARTPRAPNHTHTARAHCTRHAHNTHTPRTSYIELMKLFLVRLGDEEEEHSKGRDRMMRSLSMKHKITWAHKGDEWKENEKKRRAAEDRKRKEIEDRSRRASLDKVSYRAKVTRIEPGAGAEQSMSHGRGFVERGLPICPARSAPSDPPPSAPRSD